MKSERGGLSEWEVRRRSGAQHVGRRRGELRQLSQEGNYWDIDIVLA